MRPLTTPMRSKPIYLDHNATTPLDSKVLEAMLPALTEHFGNPSASGHAYGWSAQALVEKARTQVATGLRCSPQEVIFTAGATESNNLCLQGIFADFKGHLITTAIEHPSVLAVAKQLQKRGVRVDFIEPQQTGVIAVEQILAKIAPDTRLVSVMMANNEIGSINPIPAIAELLKAHKHVKLHSDCTQVIGKVPLDLSKTKIDFVSLSAHKFYGPKGIGALIASSESIQHLEPCQFGGGQEEGRRPGTLNVAGIVGFGRALELAVSELSQRAEHYSLLTQQLIKGLSAANVAFKLNGHEELRLPDTLSLTFVDANESSLTTGLYGLAVSQSSACSSAKKSPSHVLTAIGLSPDEARRTIRLGVGLHTTPAEIAQAIEILVKATS